MEQAANATEVIAKIDSKCRSCIPVEIREQIGNSVTLKRPPEGFLLLPGKHLDAVEIPKM